MSDQTFFKHQKKVFSSVLEEAKKAVDQKRYDYASKKLQEIESLLVSLKEKITVAENLLMTLEKEFAHYQQELRGCDENERKILLKKIKQNEIDTRYLKETMRESAPQKMYDEYKKKLGELRQQLFNE